MRQRVTTETLICVHFGRDEPPCFSAASTADTPTNPVFFMDRGLANEWVDNNRAQTGQ